MTENTTQLTNTFHIALVNLLGTLTDPRGSRHNARDTEVLHIRNVSCLKTQPL